MCHPWLLLGDFNAVATEHEKLTEAGRCRGVGRDLVDLFQAVELKDLPFSGNLFTWNNSHTFCKLDHVLCNDNWSLTFPDSAAKFVPGLISDHCSMLVKFQIDIRAKRIPFKYKEIWGCEENFNEIVTQAWASQISGCPMFQVVRKLKLVKQGLQGLNLGKYSKMKSRCDEARLLLT